MSVVLELASHAQTRQIPVVLVTASPDLAVSSVNLKCVPRKPVEPYELVETVGGAWRIADLSE